MNRKNLTAAVLAGLAGVAGIVGSAQAVNINPDGLGQVLIYPYYTTNAGNLTIMSVVNTTGYAKAVKVRFLESENSQEVLDFNLYMSAYDVWSAAIGPQPDGRLDASCDPDPMDDEDVICEGPVIEIAADENTCIVPDFGKMQSFLPFAYAGDDGTQGHSRMNEGHFEIIEMGILTDYSDDFDPETLATHADMDGVWGPDCAALNDAWSDPNDADPADDGEWLKDSTAGIEAPTGGLFGGGAVVDVIGGAMHSYDATALNGWSDSGNDGLFSNHTDPGNVRPSLNSGDNMEGVVFLDDGSVWQSGELARSVDAVSFVFMHNSMMNEYTTEEAVAATTEWVVTFPTKRFYVDDNFAQLNAPLAPFTRKWEKATEDAMYATACETVALSGLWDREERTPGDATCEQLGNCGDPDDPIVSPPPPGVTPPPPPGIDPFQLCYETNVIRFGSRVDLPAETEILGSPAGNYRNIDNTDVDLNSQSFAYGWARVELDDYVEDVNKNGQFDPDEFFSRETLGGLNGLPIAGFSVNRFSNGFLEDDEGNRTLAKYGALFSHKATRKMGSSAGSAQ